jgi:hypothetical protein
MKASVKPGIYTLWEVFRMPAEERRAILEQLRTSIERAREDLAALLKAEQYILRQDRMPFPIFPEVKSDRYRHLTQKEAVKQALLEAGRPMRLAEIIEVLISNGLETHGKTAKEMESSINSVLSAGKKTKTFKRISKGVWTVNHLPNIVVNESNGNVISRGTQDIG